MEEEKNRIYSEFSFSPHAFSPCFCRVPDTERKKQDELRSATAEDRGNLCIFSVLFLLSLISYVLNVVSESIRSSCRQYLISTHTYIHAYLGLLNFNNKSICSSFSISHLYSCFFVFLFHFIYMKSIMRMRKVLEAEEKKI